MRVALVYGGEPRTFEHCIENHKKFFEGCDISSYHSTWTKDITEENMRLMKLSVNTKSIQYCDYSVPDRPDLWRFEKLLLQNKKNHPIFMFGRIQYMTSKGFEPIYSNMDDYDLVVKMRYDFEYEGRFLDYVPEVYNDKIFVTRKMGGKANPRNFWDGFAFGSPYLMSWYYDCHRFIPFSLFHQEVANWKFQPEFLISYYLSHCGINTQLTEVQPVHKFPDNSDEHRRRRTIQYYEDLLNFHPEFWGQIENDCISTPHDILIERLKESGFNV
jgi:hypothetical protein